MRTVKVKNDLSSRMRRKWKSYWRKFRKGEVWIKTSLILMIIALWPLSLELAMPWSVIGMGIATVSTIASCIENYRLFGIVVRSKWGTWFVIALISNMFAIAVVASMLSS